jgi:hypothetical protein
VADVITPAPPVAYLGFHKAKAMVMKSGDGSVPGHFDLRLWTPLGSGSPPVGSRVEGSVGGLGDEVPHKLEHFSTLENFDVK